MSPRQREWQMAKCAIRKQVTRMGLPDILHSLKSEGSEIAQQKHALDSEKPRFSERVMFNGSG